MKLDFNCIRDIMLTLEDCLQPDDSGIMQGIGADELCELLSHKNYSKGTVKAHLRFLYDSNALIPLEKYIDDDCAGVADISYPEGYAFLERLRPPDAVEVVFKTFLAAMPDKLSDFIKEIDRTKLDLLKQK